MVCYSFASARYWNSIRKSVIDRCYLTQRKSGASTMIAKRTKPACKRQNVFAATLARFVDAKRSRPPRVSSGPLTFPLFGQAASATGPAPVSLAVFAIDRVGPAAVRAAASGVEVRVLAADESTAAVIRAALAQTARRRPTDRLIRIDTD
jgi:hypothetical protein